MSELPAGWAESSIGEIADTQLGKMLSRKARGGMGARPYLRNKNVQWGRIDIDDVLEMDFSDSEFEKFRLRVGDLLVCEGGEVGRAAIWREPVSEMVFQKALHRIRTSEEIPPEYLLYFFMDCAGRRMFDAFTSGSTIMHLPQEDLRSLPVPIPPIAEQRRIVSAIEELFSKIEAAERLLGDVGGVRQRVAGRIGALRRSILEQAFTGKLVPQDPDDEPAAVLLERIRAERAAAAPVRRGRRSSTAG